MPKSRIVRLPGGGEIIPEHFHEGPGARRIFDQAVRDVLSVQRAPMTKHQTENASTKRKQAATKRTK